MSAERPAASSDDWRFTRRQIVVAGGIVAAGATAGGFGISRFFGDEASAVDMTLRPQPAEVALGGRNARTWAYDGILPGPEIRLQEGMPVRLRVENGLPDPTSIHWHGIRLRNPADGVPGFTQDAIAPGRDFVYAFTPPDPGTYLYHSHVGMQLDRGLYGPLIVEPRRETLSYDREAVLMFDDWLDGVARRGTPETRRRTG